MLALCAGTGMSIDVAPAVGSHSRGTGKFTGGGGGGGGDGGDGAAVREAGRGTPAGLAAGAGASVLESAAPAQSLLSSMALRSESLLTVSATSRANGERTPSEPLLSSPSARQVDGDEDSAASARQKQVANMTAAQRSGACCRPITTGCSLQVNP